MADIKITQPARLKLLNGDEIPVIFSNNDFTIYPYQPYIYKNAVLYAVRQSARGANTYIESGIMYENGGQMVDALGNVYKIIKTYNDAGYIINIKASITYKSTGRTVTSYGLSWYNPTSSYEAYVFVIMAPVSTSTTNFTIRSLGQSVGQGQHVLYWDGGDVFNGDFVGDAYAERQKKIEGGESRAIFNITSETNTVSTICGFGGKWYNYYINYAPNSIGSILTDESGSEYAPIDYPSSGGGGTLPDTDPYSKGGGGSTSGGGAGRYVHPNEKIAEQATPTINISESRFLTLYNPTSIQLRHFATYLWSTSTIDTWKKIIDNPMEAIISLNMLPVPVASSEIGTIQLGNWATGVSCNIAAAQFVEFDCGSLSIEPYADNYLDYSPYTAISIYLPYIGLRQLPTNAVMGKTVQVKYKVDIFSGACVAFIIVGGGVLLQYSGACAMSIPVTSQSAGNVHGGVINTASNIAAGIPAALAKSGDSILAGERGGIMGGTPVTSSNGDIFNRFIHNAAGGFMSGANSAADTSSAIMQGAATSISIGGSAAGNAGFLGSQNAYLIIEAPNICAPQSQNTFTGYPSYITATLGDLKGYTEVSSVIVENINATQAELSAIESALRTGVYINEL